MGRSKYSGVSEECPNKWDFPYDPFKGFGGWKIPSLFGSNDKYGVIVGLYMYYLRDSGDFI